MPDASRPLVGVDVGGTFTDFVVAAPGGPRVVKRRSTPDDPAAAVLAGLADLDPSGEARVVHATTVATNALLERRGARTAFVTTEGFTDLLCLGRGDRPALYALRPVAPPPLVAPADCHGAPERVGPDGTVLRPLTEAAAAELARVVASSGVEAVAICTLFGYLEPEHERRLAAAIEAAWPADRAAWITCASDILPELREFERASTTVANAFVGPGTARYLARLAAGAAPRPLAVMASHGGTLAPAEAARRPVDTLLSGPAAGVVGALAAARAAGHPRVLTFDMGGTSTDCAACDGDLPYVTQAEIDGVPVSRPMVDVHTIGAGGGSHIWLDEGGAVRIGPRSAGAHPGPAAYGLGGRLPTVTDADVVLGRLPAALPLAGGLMLDAAAAERALAPLATRLGLTVPELAAAAVAAADALIERAMRRVSVERGHDAADFTLLAFGGAGPLHACAVADGLGVRRILVPGPPGALSALGLLVGAPAAEAGRSVLGREPAVWSATFAALEATARASLAAAGLGGAAVAVARRADVRYAGQSWELVVPWPDDGDVRAAFEALHHRHYGFTRPDGALEVVTLRVRATAPAPSAMPRRFAHAPRELPASVAVRDADGRARAAPCRDRAAMRAGERLDGPAVVAQADATTYVAPGWTARVAANGDLVLEAAA